MRSLCTTDDDKNGDVLVYDVHANGQLLKGHALGVTCKCVASVNRQIMVLSGSLTALYECGSPRLANVCTNLVNHQCTMFDRRRK
jgi:hypothetical protein